MTLDEVKQYLRVDFDDDDTLIEGFIQSARRLCMDILRTDDEEVLDSDRNGKVAVLYCVAYFYEHREEADYKTLTLSLRALLSGSRKEGF